MIPKEMEYNLHYGDVRGDVPLPPHGTNTSCSVVKINVKKISMTRSITNVTNWIDKSLLQSCCKNNFYGDTYGVTDFFAN